MGLMLIQLNLTAACTLLNFPTKERIVGELKTHEYDEIGISSIMTNLLKVRRTCKLIRKHQPHVTIVVGRHIANLFTFLLSLQAAGTALGAPTDSSCAGSIFAGADSDRRARNQTEASWAPH
jgi:hypothetical protein